jgi:hypothetical protein
VVVVSELVFGWISKEEQERRNKEWANEQADNGKQDMGRDIEIDRKIDIKIDMDIPDLRVDAVSRLFVWIERPWRNPCRKVILNPSLSSSQKARHIFFVFFPHNTIQSIDGGMVLGGRAQENGSFGWC